MFNIPAGQRWIELGGGAHPDIRPNVDVRPCQDAQGNAMVDFCADFNEDLPITTEEWDGVYNKFVIEHLSWRSVRKFLSEVLRILKPGGVMVTITANTDAQLDWIKKRGWMKQEKQRADFDEASCILFGDQDYPENSHRNYLSPEIVIQLFTEAGFEDVRIQPFGAIHTDMAIEARKPKVAVFSEERFTAPKGEVVREEMRYRTVLDTKEGRTATFDLAYFTQGKNGGGYAGGGYQDFPCHEMTYRHVIHRSPESVLELGCARGYVLKRIEDHPNHSIRCLGVDISLHASLTRVVDPVLTRDVCNTPWPIGDKEYDLCFSMALLEHVPETHLPEVLREMQRTCKRGLHGIGFRGGEQDGTKATVRPGEWWLNLFRRVIPDWPVEIMEKDVLEQGQFPREIITGDGKTKFNISNHPIMFHYGWENIGAEDRSQMAQGWGYKYTQHDCRGGLPAKTGVVDYIFVHHFLEYLTYDEAWAFLKDCRRCLKVGGDMRIVVPDSWKLMDRYCSSGNDLLDAYDHINEGCSKAKTKAGKLYSLLCEHHKSLWDPFALRDALEEAQFGYASRGFRDSHQKQILRETLEFDPGFSLFMDATPKIES